jgi:hypothetical protein
LSDAEESAAIWPTKFYCAKHTAKIYVLSIEKVTIHVEKDRYCNILAALVKL